jgi:hypothetical protein
VYVQAAMADNTPPKPNRPRRAPPGGFTARHIDPDRIPDAEDLPVAGPTIPRSEDLGLREDDPSLLSDTVADEEVEADEAPKDREVELDSIFDRPAAGIETASLSRFDPEAGRGDVAIKIKAVTIAVKNTIATPFGKLILTVPVFLVGVALTIAAFTFKDTPWIVAAGVVMPIGLVLAYWRYQSWLGHKRYMYRLLETLGEDVSEFDPAKVFRRASDKAMERRKRR